MSTDQLFFRAIKLLQEILASGQIKDLSLDHRLRNFLTEINLRS